MSSLWGDAGGSSSSADCLQVRVGPPLEWAQAQEGEGVEGTSVEYWTSQLEVLKDTLEGILRAPNAPPVVVKAPDGAAAPVQVKWVVFYPIHDPDMLQLVYGGVLIATLKAGGAVFMMPPTGDTAVDDHLGKLMSAVSKFYHSSYSHKDKKPATPRAGERPSYADSSAASSPRSIVPFSPRTATPPLENTGARGAPGSGAGALPFHSSRGSGGRDSASGSPRTFGRQTSFGRGGRGADPGSAGNSPHKYFSPTARLAAARRAQTTSSWNSRPLTADSSAPGSRAESPRTGLRYQGRGKWSTPHDPRRVEEDLAAAQEDEGYTPKSTSAGGPHWDRPRPSSAGNSHNSYDLGGMGMMSPGARYRAQRALQREREREREHAEDGHGDALTGALRSPSMASMSSADPGSARRRAWERRYSPGDDRGWGGHGQGQGHGPSAGYGNGRQHGSTTDFEREYEGGSNRPRMEDRRLGARGRVISMGEYENGGRGGDYERQSTAASGRYSTGGPVRKMGLAEQHRGWGGPHGAANETSNSYEGALVLRRMGSVESRDGTEHSWGTEQSLALSGAGFVPHSLPNTAPGSPRKRIAWKGQSASVNASPIGKTGAAVKAAAAARAAVAAKAAAEAAARAAEEAALEAEAEAAEEAAAAAEAAAEAAARALMDAEAEAAVQAGAAVRARAAAESEAAARSKAAADVERARARAAVEAEAAARERAKAEAEEAGRAKAAAEAEAAAQAQAEAQAMLEAAARAKAQAEAEQAEAARIKAEQKAREEAEARIRAETEVRIRAETESRIRAETEVRMRAEAEIKARIEAEARAKAEAEAERKDKAEAEAKKKRVGIAAAAKAEAVARAKVEEEKAWEERLFRQVPETPSAYGESGANGRGWGRDRGSPRGSETESEKETVAEEVEMEVEPEAGGGHARMGLSSTVDLEDTQSLPPPPPMSLPNMEARPGTASAAISTPPHTPGVPLIRMEHPVSSQSHEQEPEMLENPDYEWSRGAFADMWRMWRVSRGEVAPPQCLEIKVGPPPGLAHAKDMSEVSVAYWIETLEQLRARLECILTEEKEGACTCAENGAAPAKPVRRSRRERIIGTLTLGFLTIRFGSSAKHRKVVPCQRALCRNGAHKWSMVRTVMMAPHGEIGNVIVVCGGEIIGNFEDGRADYLPPTGDRSLDQHLGKIILAVSQFYFTSYIKM